MLEMVKKLIVVFILTIYLAGSLNYALTYTAHLVHHLFTHTLHQHFDHQDDHYVLHSHFSEDHHHDHSHSHVIDHAIREVNDEKDGDDDPSAPSGKIEIKFSLHFLSAIPGEFKTYPDRSMIRDPYMAFSKNHLTEPPTPPPKQLS